MIRSVPIPLRAFFAAALLALPVPAVAACDTETFNAFRQLAGQWQVFRDGKLKGELAMQVTAGGCAMLEKWHTVEGLNATALHWPETTLDEDEKPATVMHQVYVDSTGWFIHADGALIENGLVYEGKTKVDDKTLLLRTTLRGLGTDKIVHIGESSADDGATWTPAFTLEYRRVAAKGNAP